jgi:hypothetical protein
MHQNAQHKQLGMEKEIKHADTAHVYKSSEHSQISGFSYTVEYSFRILPECFHSHSIQFGCVKPISLMLNSVLLTLHFDLVFKLKLSTKIRPNVCDNCILIQLLCFSTLSIIVSF